MPVVLMNDTTNNVFRSPNVGEEVTTNAITSSSSDTAIATKKYVDDNSGGGGGGVSSVNTRTGAVTLTAADVGLENANNTSDANKPVSTAQQTALNLKANLASPAFTGAPTAPTAASSTSNTQIATTAFVKTVMTTAAVTSVNTRTGAVTLSKTDVGLDNVDNVSLNGLLSDRGLLDLLPQATDLDTEITHGSVVRCGPSTLNLPSLMNVGGCVVFIFQYPSVPGVFQLAFALPEGGSSSDAQPSYGIRFRRTVTPSVTWTDWVYPGYIPNGLARITALESAVAALQAG